MLPSLDDYLHVKKLKCLPSKGMDDQRILQSDWLRAFWTRFFPDKQLSQNQKENLDAPF